MAISRLLTTFLLVGIAFVGEQLTFVGGWSLPVSLPLRNVRANTGGFLVKGAFSPSATSRRSTQKTNLNTCRKEPWRSNIDGPPFNERKFSVHLVVPCLNEQRIIRGTLETLTSFLDSKPSWDWSITVVDNGCTDETQNIARDFAAQCSGQVNVIDVPQCGRGNALRTAWMGSDAAVQCYCDADLSSDLDSLASAVEAVASGRSDIAVASRVAPGSVVRGRTLLRDITSYGYILLLRLCFLETGLSDCQCGCKALSRDSAQQLLPVVEDSGWFFDTEMLLLAVGSGYSVQEVPVVWQDDRDSRVRVWSTVSEMLRGIFRLKIDGWRNRLAPKTRTT